MKVNWKRAFSAFDPCELDPVVMARQAGLDLDPWQAKLARSKAPKILINCSRQSGKSTIVSVVADHMAFYEDESPILLLSPSLRQSSELFRKCLDVYRALGKPVAADAENKLSLELKNGSRIVSLPGKEGTTRGFSGVRLLIIDEASQVPDELYMSVKPMLAVSGGRLIVLSSPFGTRGFFYEAYKNRRNWEYYEVPATECPRISKEFLESEREEMGEWWFQQEYMCKFMDAQTSAFRSEDIKQIVKPGLETWAL
jgi:phage terminase large subunit-like protein